jgi:hypothetical protein
MKKFVSHFFLVPVVLLLSACASQGPLQIEQDRFDYGSFMADSWKNQGLMNIVRMRYLDWPVFMEIQQVLTSYKWEILPAVKAELKVPQGDVANRIEGLVTAKYAENPTVLYKPLTGAAYSKAMLSPARPGVLFALIKTGLPADQLFRTSVHSVNGFHNDHLEDTQIYQATDEFIAFANLLRKLQLQNAVSVDIRTTKRSVERVILKFRTQNMDQVTLSEWVELKKQMGLSSNSDKYEVVFGAASLEPDIIAVRTRSILQVMQTLSVYVDVPKDDLANDLVPALENDKSNGSAKEYEPLIKIRSGPKAPDDAYAAIKYRGNWFWIPDTEARSKGTFQFLSLLLTITESGESGGGQVVIPAG